MIMPIVIAGAAAMQKAQRVSAITSLCLRHMQPHDAEAKQSAMAEWREVAQQRKSERVLVRLAFCLCTWSADTGSDEENGGVRGS